MSLCKVVVSSILATSLALPLSANAAGSSCALRPFKPSHVAPLKDVVEGAFGSRTENLAGAQLFVPAQPGLTPEWIRASAERHVAAMGRQPMPDCPLAVDGIKVAVVSNGTGFWVQMVANNPRDANEVLRRAKTVVP